METIILQMAIIIFFQSLWEGPICHVIVFTRTVFWEWNQVLKIFPIFINLHVFSSLWKVLRWSRSKPLSGANLKILSKPLDILSALIDKLRRSLWLIHFPSLELQLHHERIMINESLGLEVGFQLGFLAYFLLSCKSDKLEHLLDDHIYFAFIQFEQGHKIPQTLH